MADTKISADTDTKISAETDTETDNFRSLIIIIVSLNLDFNQNASLDKWNINWIKELQFLIFGNQTDIYLITITPLVCYFLSLIKWVPF
jgi:hypothetical protein